MVTPVQISTDHDDQDEPALQDRASIHLPSLSVALAIMLVGSIYPLLFADVNGKADHGLAMALFWAMSAGLVRGVGFVPRARLWRLMFSGWSCSAGLVLAAWLRWGV
ncbi:MAG: cyd operon YbgE family protein [Rhodoferax sp.]|uniref:cyd operon YbgE family protein n=1 Tax=Rhodoferax sp. TaxID=50421 RepID=UPI002719A27A|nr:cyd operon YbgE family protein [Rhodoferax sp.]MDO8449746.1 cyd operon YbgE family protein [Rhodoferax sp.]